MPCLSRRYCALPLQKVLYPAEGTCKAPYCILRLIVLSWVLRIFMENMHTKRKLQTKQYKVVYCTLPRCIQLFLCQVWLMEAVGDEAVFQFSNASSNCQAAVVSSDRVIHNQSRSSSLKLAGYANASVLASSCLGAPATAG